MHVDTYIITFDTNGGFPGTFTREIHAGQTISSIAGPNPQKEGCSFRGWFCRKQDGSFINFGSKGFSDITHDLTVIAQWNPNDCTIRYDGNGTGSTVIGTNPVSKKYWEVINNLPSAERAGYDFIGWFTHPQYGKQITQLTQVTGNATYYAHWKPGNYVVTFYSADGQTVPSRTLTYEKPIGALPTLERTGYTFEGWWTSASGGEKVKSTTLVRNDMTIIARWEAIPYKIEWDMGGHGVLPSGLPTEYTIESPRITPPPPAEIPGWTFTGWNPEYIETGSTNDRKFVATWERKEYTITFSAPDATGAKNSWEYDIKWEQEISEALEAAGDDGFPEPERTGYQFTGWYTSTSGGSVVYETALYTTDGDSTYYAHWEANEYTITFDSQEGEPESYEKVIKYDQNPREIMPDPHPLKTGYSFIGWYDSPAGGHPIDWDEPYHFTNDTIYYAIWMPITYTVAYDGNNNTGGATESSGHVYDVYKSLTPNGFVRENTITYNPEGGTCNKPSDRISATFLGWSLVRNGYKQFGDRQSVINLAETYGATVNLYAKWELGKVELPEVTKRGYTFLGWYTEATDGTKIGEAGYTFEVSEDMNLHAHWLANKYMIVLDSRGGTPAVQTLTVNFNQTITSDMFNHPTRTGYEFTKWTDKDGHDVNFNFNYTFDENTTYYANWEKQKISIVFSKNETANPNAPGEIWAQLPSSNANAKRMDESFTISGLLSSLGKSNPTRDKYQFLGWATSPTATIPEYGGLAWPNIVQFNRDMNLYAVWEYIECKVYFKTAIGEVQMAANAANGIGEGQNDEGRYLTIRKGQPFAGDMPSCKRSGGDQTEEDMEFLGWFTQPIGGSIVTSNTSIEGETRLFSQWTSKDAMDAYQSRSQNIDEYLKELLSQLQDVLDEDGNPTGEKVKVNPAEEKRKAMAALFDTANGGANQTAYRLSNAGMEPAMVRPTTPQTRINVYFYSDGSSESGLRHEHPDGKKTYNVCCDHYTWELNTYRYKLPAASSPDGKDNYFLMVPVFPMMNMGTTPPKTWRDYKFPQDDFTIPAVLPNVESTKDGVQAPLWSKAGQNTPGWVLMDMTKNRGWGRALETGETIPHNKTEQTAAYGGVTFSSSVTYFNNIYSPDLDRRNSYTIKWIWLNEQLKWNGCYSFWADFSPKPVSTAETGERIKAFPDRL